MIPEAAVEAAARAQYDRDGLAWDDDMIPDWECEDDSLQESYRACARAALEAAAPHMLSHERQQAADADLDARVNARTVDKLNAAIERVEALCRQEDARQTSKAYAAVDDIRAVIIAALQ